MRQGSRSAYEGPADLPLADLEAGTNVLVEGPSGRGARQVALQLAIDLRNVDEAALLLSADVSGRSLLERCERLVPHLDRSRIAIVDAAGAGDDEQARFEPQTVPIENPSALPEIGIELSTLYETLVDHGHDRIRLGVFSVSSLLAHANVRAVSRFVHMLTGRVIATGDLGIFLVDESTVDDRAVETIEQFVDGRIEVRDVDSEFELRTVGLENQPTAWTTVQAVEE